MRIQRVLLIYLLVSFTVVSIPVSLALDNQKDIESSIPVTPESDKGKKVVNPDVEMEFGELPMFLNEDPFFTWSEFDRSKENPIFRHGETLKYEVSWMGIKAGTITMTLDVDAVINGQPAIKLIVSGSTNKTFSSFFKVHDVITSYINPSTFNSLHYIKDVREGKYRKLQETVYDEANRIARVKGKEFPVPPNSKDPIACIFAMRRYPPEENIVIRMNSNSEGKNNYPVEIAFTNSSTVKLGDGVTRNAVIGKPLPTWEGRVFEKRRSTVIMWLSHDEYAVPMKLETKVRIGTMKAELIHRSGPGWELNLEKK